MSDRLIDSRAQAIENIRRYQTELDESSELVRRMGNVRHWCAIEEHGRWLFAPSKFVGYENNTADDYLKGAGRGRDGRETEKTLKRWFETAPQDLGVELRGALSAFLEKHERLGPNRKANIHVLKEASASVAILGEALADAADAASPKVLERIAVDAAVCGGRPHIRGTRVRVCDILELLAAGAPQSDVLADYPYLSEADLRAALAYGAAASERGTAPAA